MIRRNRLMTTLLTLATAATAVPAIACPPGGRGSYSGGYYGPAPVYRPVQRHVRTVPQAPAARSVAAAPAAGQVTAATIRATAAEAKAAFVAKNYGTALSLMDRVVKAAPKNNEALQFRSLIRFAMADYKLAAADAYDAMKYGPLWNKRTIDSLYADAGTYARHLKALEAAASGEPESLEVHFLLAYPKLMGGDLESGEKELKTVLRIKPSEPMAETLLKAVAVAREQPATVARGDS